MVAAVADVGGDVAIGSLARLASRVASVESRGRRGLALRFNANDPASVALALAETRAKLGPLDLLIHVAPHELVGPPERLDACTAAAVDELRGRHGAVLYLLDSGDPFPGDAALREHARGLLVAGLLCAETARAEEVASAALTLFAARSRVAPAVHTLEAARALRSSEMVG